MTSRCLLTGLANTRSMCMCVREDGVGVKGEGLNLSIKVLCLVRVAILCLLKQHWISMGPSVRNRWCVSPNQRVQLFQLMKG